MTQTLYAHINKRKKKKRCTSKEVWRNRESPPHGGKSHAKHTEAKTSQDSGTEREAQCQRPDHHNENMEEPKNNPSLLKDSGSGSGWMSLWPAQEMGPLRPRTVSSTHVLPQAL
jgi:hypothetical protein